MKKIYLLNRYGVYVREITDSGLEFTDDYAHAMLFSSYYEAYKACKRANRRSEIEIFVDSISSINYIQSFWTMLSLNTIK